MVLAARVAITAGMVVMMVEKTVKAQLSLGLLYGLGRGVALEYKEGVKWNRKAAE